MFWQTQKPSRSNLIAQIVAEIKEGQLRNRPLAWFVLTDADRRRLSADEIAFYDLFSWFPFALEQKIGHGWTVDATDTTVVHGYDSPMFGRQFVVHYNNLEMGKIDVSPCFDSNVMLHFSIYPMSCSLHLIPYAHAHQLLSAIETLLAAEGPRCKADASTAAAAALGGYLWEVVRTSQLDSEATYPVFEHDIRGPCTVLKECVDHWQKGSIPPHELVRWRYEPT